jgi:predicted nucleic acid-binding protein
LRHVVSDTGPILHLHEARTLHLLQPVGEIVVPPAVNEELGRWIGGWNDSRPDWIKSLDLPASAAEEWRPWCDAGILHAGEAQALALARRSKADWFLTDEAGARLIGERLGFEVHGSLGVVLWAAAVGRVDAQEARESLGRLFRSSLWVSARVRAEVLAAVDLLFPR